MYSSRDEWHKILKRPTSHQAQRLHCCYAPLSQPGRVISLRPTKWGYKKLLKNCKSQAFCRSSLRQYPPCVTDPLHDENHILDSLLPSIKHTGHDLSCENVTRKGKLLISLGPSFCWPLVLTQREPNHVKIPIFSYGEKKILKGGHGPMAPLK